MEFNTKKCKALKMVKGTTRPKWNYIMGSDQVMETNPKQLIS